MGLPEHAILMTEDVERPNDESRTSHDSDEDEDQALIATGLKLLDKGNANDAVTCFQNYLRIHPTSYECWQCLANAYMQRGSYNTALRAFLKSIGLRDQQATPVVTESGNDTHLYSELKIAEIHRLVHSYEEAVQDYLSILESNADYVPALIGLGETLFLIGQQAFANGFIYTGYRASMQAMLHLRRAVELRGDLCIAYDLLCQCNLAVLMHTNREQKVLRVRSIEEGIRFANCALSINCGVPGYWHHLGLFYWFRHEENDDCTTYLGKTVQCLLNALKLQPANRNIWNTLGVVAADCLPFAQHCFLKALKCSAANSEGLWNNLAICYLLDASRYMHFADEAVMRAHQAFCESQAQNPYFVNCWIGQALVAESLSHHDTLDLFRHCNTLAYHPLAAVKFAYHLLHEPHFDPSKRDLYTLCIDRLCRYIEKDCDYVAYNLLGNLYERLGYQRQALVQFEHALTYSTNANEFEKQSILTNFIRNALHVYGVQQLAKYEDLCARSWQVAVYFAVGYCKQNEFDVALEKAQTALELVEPKSELYEHIRSLRYLIVRKLSSAHDPWQNPLVLLADDDSAVQFDHETDQTTLAFETDRHMTLDVLKNNPQLRVAIVLDALKQRRFDQQLQRIFALMFEHPSLLDGLLLTLFSANASKQLVHCHPQQAHCWILHALNLLIHADRAVSRRPAERPKLRLYVQVFQQIVVQTKASMNLLVAGYLISALGLLQTAIEPIDRRAALSSAQAAYHIKPYSSRICTIFKWVRAQCDVPHQSTPDKPIDLPLNRTQLVQYILTLLY